MKKTLVLACCLALAAVANQNQPQLLSNHRHGGLPEKATCTANCLSGTVTCTASSAGNCVAQNANCPTTQGYVTCDGFTTFCSTTCGGGGCTEGATRYVWDGSSCCDNNTKEKEQQVCSGGVWQYTGAITCGGPCGPRDPWPPIQ